MINLFNSSKQEPITFEIIDRLPFHIDTKLLQAVYSPLEVDLLNSTLLKKDNKFILYVDISFDDMIVKKTMSFKAFIYYTVHNKKLYCDISIFDDKRNNIGVISDVMMDTPLENLEDTFKEQSEVVELFMVELSDYFYYLHHSRGPKW